MDNELRNRVLVVGSSESYLPHSVIQRLRENDMDVFFSNGDIDTLNKAGMIFGAILIFADEILLELQNFLVYLKDIAVEQELAVFMIGYPDDLSDIYKLIPEYMVGLAFPRPINANDAVAQMCSYLKVHDNSVKKKILVVDDSAATLRSIKNLLGEKYQIILASSGAMAFKYLVQDHPDLILLDYEMPIISGKQVLEMIRSESEYEKTPVIFLTSHGDKESILNVMHLHPEGYLLKTMELSMVEKAIDEFFEKQKNITK